MTSRRPVCDVKAEPVRAFLYSCWFQQQYANGFTLSLHYIFPTIVGLVEGYRPASQWHPLPAQHKTESCSSSEPRVVDTHHHHAAFLLHSIHQEGALRALRCQVGQQCACMGDTRSTSGSPCMLPMALDERSNGFEVKTQKAASVCHWLMALPALCDPRVLGTAS